MPISRKWAQYSANCPISGLFAPALFGVGHSTCITAISQYLHHSHLAPLVDCEGDPVTIGFFQDELERLYMMVVNGSPCTWAKITLKVGVSSGEKLLVFDLNSAQFRELWPADPHQQLVTLAPGEGRLLKVDGSGLGVNF